ncbi:MAG: hypothetical protein JWQ40_3142 [Segetibacter sp.]|jgi:hypothetical protein|nr:hypothetical protein [Segetibacter sp.]
MIRISPYLVIFFSILNLCASAQLQVGDQPTVSPKVAVMNAQGSNGLQGLWLPRVTDTSVTGIRQFNPPDGIIIYHPPSGKLFLRSKNAWVSFAGNAIDRVIAGGQTQTGPAVTFNTGTTGNDFNVTSASNTVTYQMPNASITARGVVNTTNQTFAGTKTFNNGVTVNRGATINNGTTANNGLTVTGVAGSTSSLTLGITSATPVSGISTNMLTVDAAGKVFLTTNNVQANKPSRILNYTLTIYGGNVAPNSTYTVNTPLPAVANVSFPATVYISPSTMLSTGTTVDWATIINNNLVANISTRANSQNFTNYIFYVTIIDF